MFTIVINVSFPPWTLIIKFYVIAILVQKLISACAFLELLVIVICECGTLRHLLISVLGQRTSKYVIGAKEDLGSYTNNSYKFGAVGDYLVKLLIIVVCKRGTLGHPFGINP